MDNDMGDQGAVEIIRPDGRVERMGERPTPGYSRTAGALPPLPDVPARADRRRHDRAPDNLVRGRLVDLVG